MYDYQENYSRLAAEREKVVYERMLTQYDALLTASIEGVFEVTVRSQSGAITIPVTLSDGISLTHELIECFSERIESVERNLNTSLAELGAETKHGKTTSDRLVEVREKNAVEFAAWQAAEQSYLAQQAATTATPTQKGPGRPKKAITPKPELMEAVGVMAAQVPMNGSTANAAALATGSMPQG
jgi:uncharacterized protein (DUF885 family)